MFAKLTCNSSLRLRALGRASTLALTLLGSASWSSAALACKCRPVELAEARTDAQVIFEGRVSKISDEAPSEGGPPPGKQITLAIVRTWKGVDNVETVTVRSNESSASCGFTFELNTSYLVYAGGTTDALSVSSCSRTRPMAEASEDLAALGAGITPVKVDPEVDAGASDGGAASDKPATVRQGGCAGGRGNASAALWMVLPAVGLLITRRKRETTNAR